MKSKSTNPELMPTKNTSVPHGPVNFTTRDGKKHELSLSKIDAWFSSIQQKHEKYDPKDPKSHYEMIRRFGIQNADDLIFYLKSPEGKEVIKHIMEELAIIAYLNEQSIHQAQEAEKRHRRMLAFLLLALLHKKDARAKERQLIMLEEDIKKRLQGEKPTANEADMRHEILLQQLEYYNEGLASMELALKDKRHQKTLIDEEIIRLVEQAREMNIRHQAFNAPLSRLASIAAQNPTIDNLENTITVTEESLKTISVQIAQHVANNEKAAAAELMNKHNAEALVLSGMKDLKDVLSGNRSLYNKHGELCNSYNNAHYHISINQKIVKDNQGKLYLIPINKELDTLSEQEKQAYHQQFKDNKLVSLTTHTLIEKYCNSERKLHNETMHNARQQQKELQDGINLIATKIQEVNVAIANTRKELEELTPHLTANQLIKAAPKLPIYESKLFHHSEERVIKDIRETLNEIERGPITQAQINSLQNNLTILYAKNQETMPEIMKRSLNQLNPSRMLPLRDLYTLSIIINKAIKPRPNSENAPQVSPSTAPTPFKTSPY